MLVIDNLLRKFRSYTITQELDDADNNLITYDEYENIYMPFVYFFLAPVLYILGKGRINSILEIIKTCALLPLDIIYLTLASTYTTCINFGKLIDYLYLKLNNKNIIRTIFLASFIITGLGYHFAIIINMPAAIIATSCFAILSVISTFSKKTNDKDQNSISARIKFLYLFLSTAAPITAFILEYNSIYMFTPISLIAAILTPSLIMITIMFRLTQSVKLTEEIVKDSLTAKQSKNFKQKIQTMMRSNFEFSGQILQKKEPEVIR